VDARPPSILNHIIWPSLETGVYKGCHAGIPEKKTGIKLKYKVRNSKKNKTKQQKNKRTNTWSAVTKKIDVIFLSKANVLFRSCMSLIPLQATCHFTFNKSSISDLYTYFSRERESRKVSTCYRSKRAFGDLGKTTIFNGLLGNRPNVFCWASDYLIWSSFWSPE
jgi:hypothetical protein